MNLRATQRMRSSKRAFSSFLIVILLVVAIVGAIGMFTVLGGILDLVRNPDRISAEGTVCRLSIIFYSKMEEVSLHTAQRTPECNVIEKTLPLSDSYTLKTVSKTKRVKDMTSSEYQEALEEDFVELIARAWWMSGEGERPQSLLTAMDSYILTDNKCLVLYSARLKTPKKTDRLNPDQIQIDQTKMVTALSRYRESEAFHSPVPTDSTIQDYIGTTGETAGVYLVKWNENTKAFGTGTIDFKSGDGADPIYGVAVGFEQKAEAGEALKRFFGVGDNPLSSKSSYILIAPFDQMQRFCTVKND